MPRFAPFLLALCLLTAPALHAQNVTLAPFPADGTFATTQVQDMTMVITVETGDSTMAVQMGAMQQEMKMRQTIDGTLTVATEEGKKRLVQTTHRVRMEGTIPGQGDIAVDSDVAEDLEMAALGPLRAWIDRPIVMYLADDEVTVENLDSLLATMLEGNEEMQQLKREAFAEMITSAVQGTIEMLPTSPVGVGDTFAMNIDLPLAGMGEARITGTFTVASIDGPVVTYGGPITISSDMAAAGMPMQLEMRGDGTVDIVYNTATGEQTNTSDMTMAAQMDMTGMMGPEKALMNMLLSMQQTQTITRR